MADDLAAFYARHPEAWARVLRHAHRFWIDAITDRAPAADIEEAARGLHALARAKTLVAAQRDVPPRDAAQRNATQRNAS